MNFLLPRHISALRCMITLLGLTWIQMSFGQLPSDVTKSAVALTSARISVSGQAVDADSDEPLEYATVSIYRQIDSSLITGALTNVDGRFVLEMKAEHAYAVIEFIGYDAVAIELEPERMPIKNRGVLSLGTIKLTKTAVELDLVEIRAEKSETQFALDKRIFNVGKDLANQGGSAIDVLDNVPSVTVDVEGQISLRGSAGVRILVNGQRTGLGDNLRSIPSNQIERIEVITNPSARYDAEGMAGIINIVLKKDDRFGFNGSFDANVGYPFMSGLGFNVNYRKNKINWFAGYGLSYNERPGGGFQYTEIRSTTGVFITDQRRDFERTSLSNTIRFGMDYFFNPKTSLTGSFRYQYSDDDNFSTNYYADYFNSFPDNPISNTIRTDDEGEDESQLEYSLNFRKEFSSRKHSLNILLDYEDELETESSIFLERIQPLGDVPTDLNQRSNNDEGQKEWVFQADYVHPFSKDHQMEFGLKASFRDITNDFLVEEFNEDKWDPLDGLSNNFIYGENIIAAYGQYGNKFDKLSYQLGLRTEYADISTELVQTNERNDRRMTNLFPSVFINYEFAPGDVIQMSYSRRIRRPHFWHLNPFFTYNDSRNFFVGNPNLNPEYTDSYEINYLKYWEKSTLNAGLFYRHSTGVIERIRSLDDLGRTTLKPENLSTRDDFGAELTFDYKAIDWLRFDASVNFFRTITNGKNLGESFFNDSYTWTARSSVRVEFWKSDLQIRTNYRAPRETTQGRNKSITSIDLGWSKDLLPKKNLTITLSIRDVFNSRKRRYTQFGPDFITDGEFQWRQRSTNLALNYRINQKKRRQQRSGNFEGGEGF